MMYTRTTVMDSSGAAGDESSNTFLTIFNKNSGSSKIHYYQVDPEKKSRLIPKMFSTSLTRLKDVTGYRAVSYDKCLYIIGGRDWETGSFRKHILRFDTRTNTWSRGASMKTPRFRHTATVVNGVIYVIGGEGKGGKILNSVEIYNPVYDLWAEMSHLPRPRADHATCVLDNTLYVSGGCIDINNQLSDSFWKFDLEEDDFWSDVMEKEDCLLFGIDNALPEVREKHCMASCRNKIYLLGGITVEREGKHIKPKVDETVYSFDPENPGWRKETVPTHNPRCSAAVAVLGHNILVIGGQKLHGTDVTMIEYYNTVKKTWTELFNITESGLINVDCCVVDVPMSNKEFSNLGLAIKGRWILW